MEANREDLLSYLYSLYKQLGHLQQEQWKQLHSEDINWAVISKLTEQWNDLSRSAEVSINEHQMTSWRKNPSQSKMLEDMELLLREMSQRANLIEQKIERFKTNASEDIKGLKVHQNVLSAYGGLDRPNISSIYFDEKK